MASLEVTLYGQFWVTPEAALPMWVESRSATKLGIMKEMDSFYQNGANISLPIANVFEYSMMKLGGATKLQLDIYLTDSRQKAFR